MSEIATRPTDQDVTAFLEAVEHPVRRADAVALDALFRQVTGWEPVMWGSSIVGYGQYRYRYENGREGRFLATGFSPRKASLSLYIMPGHAGRGAILPRLGKHRTGRACLYVNKLADIDREVLAELIAAGLEDLGRRWPVSASPGVTP
ncbi:DUF1801 domain-containing protein [Rhodophyticola porphyridii]|uniref:DUF1801 domain-containing protein n=1 Tax=Rhodophyticola porphyridii TaxID=1852017 RepID=UPI0035CF7514